MDVPWYCARETEKHYTTTSQGQENSFHPVGHYPLISLSQTATHGGVCPDDISLILVIQGVHWIDTYKQRAIYNPLTHPPDPPVHEYQAYIISQHSHLAQSTESSFDFIKLPRPPVEAFGNDALRPWFWFQSLHNWKPGIQDLVLCSVTAGNDIGLLARGNETDPSKRWRVWITEAENRRATVPYDMERNEETIV